LITREESVKFKLATRHTVYLNQQRFQDDEKSRLARKRTFDFFLENVCWVLVGCACGDVMKFHHVHGENIRLSEDGKKAVKDNNSFSDGITFR
jgi:hypothetical protein